MQNNTINSWSRALAGNESPSYPLGFYLKYTLIKQYRKHKHLSHAEIVAMHRRLRSGEYEFGCMYRLYIPKAPGKVGLRPITIPHRLDRALLRALHLTLTEALIPLMSPKSHGFLPNRGCLTLYAELGNIQGVNGIKYMDVRKCFDHMNHAKVIEQLTSAGAPPGIVKLISNYMCSEIKDKEKNDYTNRGGIGIPQGGAISPMLMNLYLSSLDKACENTVYLRYADDIIMLRRADEKFVDLTSETKELGIELMEDEKGPNERGEHLGGVVKSTSEGKISTEVNYLKLKKKWTARAETRDKQMSAMEDQALLKYISTIMVGVALYVGSVSVNRERTLQFIRSFHTNLAWSHLLRRYTYKEITSNDKLYSHKTLRIPNYQTLRSLVDRLCLSIQISRKVGKVRMRELIGFEKRARKVVRSKLFGLFTMSQEIVADLYLRYCRHVL